MIKYKNPEYAIDMPEKEKGTRGTQASFQREERKEYGREKENGCFYLKMD